MLIASTLLCFALKEPKEEWEVGWSFEIIVTGLVFQVISMLAVGYGLLLLPIIEEESEEEGEEGKEEDKK